MGLGSSSFAGLELSEDIILGSGTDPATTLDISAAIQESNAWVQCYWYLPDAITLDSAETTTIEEFECTWQYQHFEASGVNF